MPKQTYDERRQYHREYNARQRLELIQHFGGCCAQCGFSDWRALQIDHVNGGGTQERLAHKTNPRAYYRQMLDPENTHRYQLLCANCNQVKRYECSEATAKL